MLMQSVRTGKRRRLQPTVALLEDRCLLSSGALDLTTAGASGVINGAIFQQANFQPTGSGVIDSFVRIREKGVEYGYNTDVRPYTDPVLTNGGTQTTATFDHSIKRSDVPAVFIGGKQYYQFTLDINQNAKNPLLSLDQVQIFLGSAPDLQGYAAGNLGTKIYDTANDPNYGWVKLNYNLNGGGSGKGDMLLDVPTSDFTGPNPYIYLYSHFGGQILNGTADTQNGGSANAGYEEWTIPKQATPCQVQPVLLTSTGAPQIYTCLNGQIGELGFSDAATLANGNNPTGTLSFTLTIKYPDGSTKVLLTDTQTVGPGVSHPDGNGTYFEFAPVIAAGNPIVGTYTWSVVYSGDANNLSAMDQGGPLEQYVFAPLQPTITTTAAISTYPPNISDTAVISGGYFPSGQLVFTLTGPSGVVYTQTDTVTGVVDTTGSATYTATTAAPIIPGTYTWSVAYLGDANNLPVSELGGPSETVVIAPIYPPPA